MNKEKVWQDCLKLWKRLSEMPDEPIRGMMTTFKNSILAELGIKKCENGCPFCEHYKGCDGCPLARGHPGLFDCYDTPYNDWEWEPHKQKIAKKFYEYLLDLHDEESKK